MAAHPSELSSSVKEKYRQRFYRLPTDHPIHKVSLLLKEIPFQILSSMETLETIYDGLKSKQTTLSEFVHYIQDLSALKKRAILYPNLTACLDRVILDNESKTDPNRDHCFFGFVKTAEKRVHQKLIIYLAKLSHPMLTQFIHKAVMYLDREGSHFIVPIEYIDTLFSDMAEKLQSINPKQDVIYSQITQFFQKDQTLENKARLLIQFAKAAQPPDSLFIDICKIIDAGLLFFMESVLNFNQDIMGLKQSIQVTSDVLQSAKTDPANLALPEIIKKFQDKYASFNKSLSIEKLITKTMDNTYVLSPIYGADLLDDIQYAELKKSIDPTIGSTMMNRYFYPGLFATISLNSLMDKKYIQLLNNYRPNYTVLEKFHCYLKLTSIHADGDIENPLKDYPNQDYTLNQGSLSALFSSVFFSKFSVINDHDIKLFNQVAGLFSLKFGCKDQTAEQMVVMLKNNLFKIMQKFNITFQDSYGGKKILVDLTELSNENLDHLKIEFTAFFELYSAISPEMRTMFETNYLMPLELTTHNLVKFFHELTAEIENREDLYPLMINRFNAILEKHGINGLESINGLTEDQIEMCDINLSSYKATLESQSLHEQKYIRSHLNMDLDLLLIKIQKKAKQEKLSTSEEKYGKSPFIKKRLSFFHHPTQLNKNTNSGSTNDMKKI